MNTDQHLLTLDEVAQRLGVSRDWARDHATRRNPRIPVVRLGGKRALLRFRPQDVDQFISEHLISEPERGV
jgi:excisionase family DNA binding protein